MNSSTPSSSANLKNLSAIALATLWFSVPAFPQTCTNLCLQQVTCPGNGTTSISGTVYAPNGVDPLPNVLVYIPNSAVQPFTAGVACAPAEITQPSGSPLVSASSDASGNFTLTDAPVGTNIPLVIQAGRWRRQVVIPSIASCVNTALPSPLTSLPSPQSQGDIPHIAIVTGADSSIECVLRKIGIADSEFSNPSGAGRINFYLGSGGPGARIEPGTTPPESDLWGTQATLNEYDSVIFACQGAEYDQSPAAQNNVINYANRGGRIIAEHYAYVWLYNDPPFSGTALWNVDQAPEFTNDPETAVIDQTFPEGQLLAQWLQANGATTTQGQLSLASLRHDQNGVIAPTQSWLTISDSTYPSAVMQLTFNTPVGNPVAEQCGRVQFNEYHVDDPQANNGGVTFPQECSATPLSAEEKLLEFSLFDLPTSSQQSQIIFFGALADQPANAPPFNVSATASSGLPVTFMSDTSSTCSVSGNTVTLLAAGQCSIEADQAGNGSYLAALPVIQSFQINLVSQTISFGALPNQPYSSSPFMVSASASSGLSVSFLSTTPSTCGVSGTSVTLLGVGQCSAQATQAGNATYAAATPVTQSFQVTQAMQVITFGALPNQPMGTSPFPIAATASSGLTVSFASSTSACTVSGNTVTLVAPGACSIEASQAGNVDYAAAAPIIQSFVVTRRPQTITFGSLSNEPIGTPPFAVSAASSSGLPVSFASASSACMVSGSTVSLVAAGPCAIVATQAGNATYARAANVLQIFQVTRLAQTISFGSLPNESLESPPFNLSATASSGLTVTFASLTSTCTVSGNTVTLIAKGRCTIEAAQSGNGTYSRAVPVFESFVVTQ